MSSRVELNLAAIEQIGREHTEMIRSVLNEVASTHSGQSENEIRGALRSAISRRGLRLEPSEEWVQAIATGKTFI